MRRRRSSTSTGQLGERRCFSISWPELTCCLLPGQGEQLAQATHVPRRGRATTVRLPMPISFASVDVGFAVLVILEFIRKINKMTAGIATCDMRPMTRVCWQQIKSHKRHQIMCGTWVLRLNGCPFPASLKGKKEGGQPGSQAGLFVNPSAPANKVFQFLSHNKQHKVFAP